MLQVGCYFGSTGFDWVLWNFWCCSWDIRNYWYFRTIWILWILLVSLDLVGTTLPLDLEDRYRKDVGVGVVTPSGTFNLSVPTGFT